MILINGENVNVTTFPDKTTQVWKLSDTILHYLKHDVNPTVTWHFDGEEEVFQILQLFDLINTVVPEHREITLYVPFMPYARQDKNVDNNLTFALRTFLKVISLTYAKLVVFDVHSQDLLKELYPNFENIEPVKEIADAIFDSKSNTLCFPDKGAKTRYEHLFPGLLENSIVLEKTRDQVTGSINGIKLADGYSPELVKYKQILIVDDICDGGRTFIEAAKVLYSHGADTVNLYTSHGIYSKGVVILHEAGIKKIYDKDGSWHS